MCPVHSGRSNNVSYWTAERVADLNGQSYVSVTVAAVTMAPTYWTEERVADLNGQSYSMSVAAVTMAPIGQRKEWLI